MPKNAALIERIAKERIDRLLELSRGMFSSKDPESKALGKRYVRLMKMISSHYNVKMPRGQGAIVCKRCNNLLMPGINCTIRVVAKEGYSIYRCECGNQAKAYMKKQQGSLGS